MTNAALRGKPDVGNPHVAPSQRYGGTSRFDEGEVASCTAEASLRRVPSRRKPEGRASGCAATPRRGALLYKTVNACCSKIACACLLLAGAQTAYAAGKPSGAAVVRPSHKSLIAHRGESVDAPENTLPAYKLAVERGFGFECDLYISKDGRVFTFHDGTLTRTTDGANTNFVERVSWEDTLSKVDVGSWGKWKGSKFAGTRPALLEEVLALARDGRQIYLEIKSGPNIVPVIKKILAAQKNATPRNVLFISFNKQVCAAVKEHLPDYKVYWLLGSKVGQGDARRPITAQEAVEGARAARADGIDIVFDQKVVDEAFVAGVKKAGLSFHVWTIDDLSKALRAFALGADTVTTNRAKDLYEEYQRTASGTDGE